MSDPLISVFDTMEEAVYAREALLASGFDGDTVMLHTNDDESGPVQGNWVAGDAQSALPPPGEGDPPSRPGALGDEYDDRFRHVVQRGTHVLLVDPPDDAARRRAVRIAERCNGREPNWEGSA